MRAWPAAAMLVAAALLLSGCVAPWEPVDTGLDPAGFAEPALGEADAVLEPLPTQTTAYEPLPRPTFQLSWSVSTVFIGGGFLDASIANTGESELWVYNLSFRWSAPGPDASHKRVSVRVPPGETARLGLLAIPPHEASGYRGYYLTASMYAWNDWYHQSGWCDLGAMDTAMQEALVHPSGTPSGYAVEEASLPYHNQWNSLLEADSPAVSELAGDISGGANFTLEAALDAFDWVTGNVRYRLDAAGDVWAPSGETIATGFGDCEDQAILVSALVTAMGGVARGYLIEGHAFAGVHVGNSSREPEVSALVAGHYGTDLPARFIRDSGKSFLVLDPAGSLYGGGLPTGAALTAGGWDFNETGVLIVVEVTGEPLERGFGQMLWGVTCGSTVFIMMAMGLGTAIAVGLVAYAFARERWLDRRRR